MSVRFRFAARSRMDSTKSSVTVNSVMSCGIPLDSLSMLYTSNQFSLMPDLWGRIRDLSGIAEIEADLGEDP